jgi:hypothetical protein
MEKDRPVVPVPWLQIGLAVVPGLVALLLHSPDTGIDRQSMILTSALVVSVGLLWKREFPPWALPAAGVLLSTLPGFILRLFFPTTGGPPPSIFDTLVNLLPIAAWGVIVLVAWRWWREVSLPKVSWLLLGTLVTVGTILNGPLLFLLVLGWMGLPVAAGLIFARRHQLLAGLLPVAGLYWIVDGIYDPSYFVPIPYSTLIEVALVFAFLVATPLWVLRARSTRAQLFGLLVPPTLALLACEILRSSVYPPGYSLNMWLIRGLGMAEILFSLVFALVLYRSFRSSTGPISHSPHSEGHTPDCQPVPANWLQ